MLGWIFGKRGNNLEKETRKGFSVVKEDVNKIGKWLKHLHSKDKQHAEVISLLKDDLATIKATLGHLHERVDGLEQTAENKQVFKKLPVLDKQTAVDGVVKSVQTAVQTGNFYNILQGLSSNERLLVFTLMNADGGMKLSYEDLARLLGKERATIRGQINAIKQKSEGLIEEVIEKNGKKRVFVPNHLKDKLQKYAKVRVGKR